ncbi:MAG: MFS transporter [Sporomusaceae bacterium]|nr:MFS transporter [Sporomusaceae bacterium]
MVRLPKNIIILGLVSLFTDISSEMIYPLIPLYLTAVLGASPTFLGIIEGIAESLASLLKVVSGRMADRLQQRKSLAILGYGLSGIGKILFVVATSWVGILWARISDRFGKGIRTAPRDAIIADACTETTRGKAFGLHRAMDTAGAVIGIALAYCLFVFYQGDYVNVFWLSIIPAAIGVALLFLVDDSKRDKIEQIKRVPFLWKNLDKKLRFFLIISFIFNLGNSSNQFLLIRAGNIGFSPEQIILLYLEMNISYLLISYPAGRLSDKIGRRFLLVLGYLVYGLVYLGFAFVNSAAMCVVLFGIYGLYSGLTDGVEKAFLADAAPGDQKASVYGLHALITGIALLPASLIAGFLWDWLGASAPFWFGGIMGIGAAISISLGLKKI